MNTLNKWLAGGSVLAMAFGAHGSAMFTDGFNYSTGSLGTVGNPPWTGGNNNIAVTSGSLLFPNLADTVPPGNQLTITSGVSAGSVGVNFNATPVSSGTVYYSFLAECTTLPTGNNYITSLLTSGSPSGGSDPLSVYVGQQTAGSTFKIGVRHNGNGSGATYTTGAWATAGAVNLFVVAYTFNAGTGDDSVSLWVNPTPGGAQPAADVTVTGGTDATGLQVVGFKAQSAASEGNWIFDTLRVGTSWGDVTPVPEPSVFALGGMAALLAAVRRKRS
jgi:hypothetical protein